MRYFLLFLALLTSGAHARSAPVIVTSDLKDMCRTTAESTVDALALGCASYIRGVNDITEVYKELNAHLYCVNDNVDIVLIVSTLMDAPESYDNIPAAQRVIDIMREIYPCPE